MDVDAGVPATRVQGAGDTPAITRHSRGWTNILSLAITIVAAGTGVLGGDKHKASTNYLASRSM